MQLSFLLTTAKLIQISQMGCRLCFLFCFITTYNLKKLQTKAIVAMYVSHLFATVTSEMKMIL